jgi:opacity protein-like surface antigen
MSKRALVCAVALCSFLLLATVSDAQEEVPFHRLTVGGGAGFTGIAGHDAGKLDHGGNVQVGGGYNFNRYFGVTGNFMFNWLGITRSALNTLNEPDGHARIYSVTVDPTFHLPIRRANAYVLAGGGFLRRTVEFTQPTLAQTLIFDPWWGYFGPALVPVNQILGTVTSNAGAFDVGAGIGFPLPKSQLHLFVELRYFHGFTDTTNTSVFPITVGIRY